jgi:hypothetical protein
LDGLDAPDQPHFAAFKIYGVLDMEGKKNAIQEAHVSGD